MSNCDLCNKLEFEKNLQEQKGSWLCPSCYNTYDDKELEEKLQ
jgi:formylmethanofuran dehydrogenase subunit E|tara:strand:+ start:260 stop:388 length:129 start_codon:yes stop_codon:yes gene_type:complete